MHGLDPKTGLSGCPGLACRGCRAGTRYRERAGFAAKKASPHINDGTVPKRASPCGGFRSTGLFAAPKQAFGGFQPVFCTKPPARPVHPPAVVRAHHPRAKAVPREVSPSAGHAAGAGSAHSSNRHEGRRALRRRAARGQRGRGAGGHGCPEAGPARPSLFNRMRPTHTYI